MKDAAAETEHVVVGTGTADAADVAADVAAAAAAAAAAVVVVVAVRKRLDPYTVDCKSWDRRNLRNSTT